MKTRFLAAWLASIAFASGCATTPPAHDEKAPDAAVAAPPAPTTPKHVLSDPDSAMVLATGPLSFYQQCLQAKGPAGNHRIGDKLHGKFDVVIDTHVAPFRLEKFTAKTSAPTSAEVAKLSGECAKKAKQDFNARIGGVLENLRKDHPKKKPFQEITGKTITVHGKMFPFTDIDIGDRDQSIELHIPELDLESEDPRGR